VIPERKTTRCKGPGFGNSCPNTRKEKIIVIRRIERAERGGRDER